MVVVPYAYDSVTDIDPTHLPFPDATRDDIDPEWEPTDTEWFVDSSGFDQPGEPALTIKQFLPVLITYVDHHPGHGFALSGIGQFQVYVQAYKRR